MLNNDDIQWLMRQIAATSEMLGNQISPTAAAMMAEDLSNFERPLLSAALSRVRSEGAPRITLKAVLDAIDASMGRPGANEAWAVALTALDEANTVVWTQEIAQAWSAARPIAIKGDLIGARMTFKDAYERLVRTSRESRTLPVPLISEGWDAKGRVAAVEKALSLGYVTAQDAAAFMPAPSLPGFTPKLLLEGVPTTDLPPSVRDRLIQLRLDISKSDNARRIAAVKKVVDEAQSLALKKSISQQLTDEFLLAADAIWRQGKAA